MTIVQKELKEIRAGDMVCMGTEVCVATSNPMWNADRHADFYVIGKNAFNEEIKIEDSVGHSPVWDVVMVDDGDFFCVPNIQDAIAAFTGTDDCVLASLKYTDEENIIDIKLVVKVVDSNTAEPVLVYEFEHKSKDTYNDDTLLFELEEATNESIMLNMLDICRSLIYEI